MGNYETRFLNTDEYTLWEKFVLDSPQGSIYSLPRYLSVLSEAAGGSFRLLATLKNGEIRGGILLYETRRFTLPIVSSRLLLYYNGFLLPAHQTKYPSERTARDIEILRELISALSASEYAHVLLHNRSTFTDVRPLIEAGWCVRPSYTYQLPLGDLPAQWLLVEKNLRRLIERCSEQGIVLTEDGDFESFFAMHQQTHQRKDAPLYLPKDRFRKFVESLRSLGLAKLYHARLSDGKAIASQLVLTGHPVTHTVCAGADGNYLKLGATAFLRWRAFEDLAKNGYAANDLTDAALNSVTHFKSQFGGELRQTWVTSAPPSPLYDFCESTYKTYRTVRALGGKVIAIARLREKTVKQ